MGDVHLTIDYFYVFFGESKATNFYCWWKGAQPKLAFIAGWWFQLLWKICKLGLLFHILWNIKNVPNHQPDRVYKPTHMSLGYLIYPDLDEKPPVPGGKNLQKIRRKGGYHLRSPSEMDGLRSQKSRKPGSERDPPQTISPVLWCFFTAKLVHSPS